MTAKVSRRMQRARSFGPFSILVGFLLFDFLPWDSARDSKWWVMLFSGLTFGQISLIAVWAGLVRVNAVIRLPVAFFFCTLLWAAVVWGRLFGPSPWTRDDTVVNFGMCVAGTVVLLQIPLWLAAFVGGWRLVVWAGQNSPPERSMSRFRLMHVMWAIMLISISLAMLRATLSIPGAIALARPTFAERFLEPSFVAVIAVVDALIVLPTIWIAFAPAQRLVDAVIHWLAYCLGLSVLMVLVSWSYLGYHRRAIGPTPLEQLEFVLTHFVYVTSNAATILLTLGVLRALGCRLERGRPQKKTPFARTASAKGE